MSLKSHQNGLKSFLKDLSYLFYLYLHFHEIFLQVLYHVIAWELNVLIRDSMNILK